MKHLLLASPKTRINDSYNYDERINVSSEGIIAYTHPMINSGPNEDATHYQADFYKHIAVDISVESVLDYRYGYVTEKSLRAFASKRMLLVVGAAGTLAVLRSKGFDVFDDFFYNEYDTIENTNDRFCMVADEIIRICNLKTSDIVDWMNQNKHRIEQNFKVLQELQQTELNRIAQEHGITQ